MKTSRALAVLVVLASSCLAATTGCAAPVEGSEDSAPAAPKEEVGASAAPLVSAEYTSDGDTITLWHKAVAFCYLTDVRGDLASREAGWGVAAYARLTVEGDYYRLSTVPGVKASARCAPYGDFRGLGPERRVSTTGGWLFSYERDAYPLWGPGSLCYLSGVHVGQKHGFDGAASSARVFRNASGQWYGQTFGGGRWEGGFLGRFRWGDTWVSEAPYGYAMCVDTRASFRLSGAPGGGDQFYWAQDRAQTWMIPVSEGVCMLTGVDGHLAGGGESVSVTQESGYWVLGGTSMQDGVAATAQCVPYNQFNFTVAPGFFAGPR